MNPFQIKALIEWYRMLGASAKATEAGYEYDPAVDAWTDPRKAHQYPFDTVIASKNEWNEFLKTPLGRRFTERKNEEYLLKIIWLYQEKRWQGANN